MGEYIVEMRDITKSFGDVHAVIDGQFSLKQGEIHSLIGENGAGKSTMLKMLYGMFPWDSGQVHIRGEHLTSMTPKIAMSHGIGMVHQEFMLVDNLTVLENIVLGSEPTSGIRLDMAKARTDIEDYIHTYNMDIQPSKKIHQISVGEAQRVEIIKALYRGADVLILDEPTAVLTPQETDVFFSILRSLQSAGKSIIFISHKLNEVMAISDRISVMRQGRYIDTVDTADTSPAQLANMMVGRDVFLAGDHPVAHPGDVVLDVNHIYTSGEKELSKIRDVSLQVRAGEILGIAGIDGNGQRELIEAIAGLRKVEQGSISLGGKDITNASPLAIRQAGLAHIPEDRNSRGLNRELSIMDNLIALRVDDAPYSTYGTIHASAVRTYAQGLIERFDIRPPSPAIPASALSGGNAQKVVIAREVDAGGSVLIAAQPSRGVDIGAIESIRAILNEVKAQGTGVLLVSADLEEILALSDRIVVLCEGHISGALLAGEANESNIGLLMMGGPNHETPVPDTTARS